MLTCNLWIVWRHNRDIGDDFVRMCSSEHEARKRAAELARDSTVDTNVYYIARIAARAHAAKLTWEEAIKE